MTLTPSERAKRLVDNMTLAEQMVFLHGPDSGPGVQCTQPMQASCAYVGNVAGNSRLGIPPLTMNDGPQGFRAPSSFGGTSTAWPSGLTIAASWDKEAVEAWGAGMGKEFKAKGSNVQLGPGLCVARVPRNGRNFEYISGEDPYLGYRLAKSAILGIQAQGVIANAKHWVLNNQETNRLAVYAMASERVRFEIYYPPFEGAIEAKVGSFMCSYNKVAGDKWSCEDPETLGGDLKGRLGFQGFVMSDWGATHSTSIAAGLDMEMPGAAFMNGSQLEAAIAKGLATPDNVRDSAVRILAPMFAVGVMDAPDGTWSYKKIAANVTTAASSASARHLSAVSTVLLKNAGILPLATTGLRNIAVIGFAAGDNAVVHAGGSGSVAPSSVVAPLDGIRAAAGAGSAIHYHNGSNVTSAATLASTSDVAIVFVQTLSSEGADRASLSIDDGCAGDCHRQNALVRAVASANAKTVVVLTCPGAVLTPWRHEVGALLTNFMPGQEAGNAIADVLFGKVNPSGKLPLTFPASSKEVAFTPQQWPGWPDPESPTFADYSEGLLVGYRYYDAHGLEPAFAFGHGLSYSTFRYSDLEIDAGALTVRFRLTNQSPRAGAEVAQLYLTFPRSAGEPPRVLKRFEKMALPPHGSAIVAFDALDPKRDLAIWDEGKHAWASVAGTFGVHVGASSRDVRLTGQFANSR